MERNDEKNVFGVVVIAVVVVLVVVVLVVVLVTRDMRKVPICASGWRNALGDAGRKCRGNDPGVVLSPWRAFLKGKKGRMITIIIL